MQIANDDQVRSKHQPQEAVEPVFMNGEEMAVTGQYVHARELKKNLFFATRGDAPRSFTVLVAVAKGEDSQSPNFNRNGLVILDNDNMAVLVEGYGRQATGVGGASSRQVSAFDAISRMKWKQFSDFIYRSDYYKGVARDIDTRADDPDSGNFARQVMLGLRRPEDRDNRDEFTRALHADGAYHLPATSREAMVNDILLHPMARVRGGMALSWDIRMNYNWDRTGRVDGCDEVSREFDKRWLTELSTRDEIFEEVCDLALSSYLAEDFSVLGMEDAACNLNTTGPNNGTLVLNGWRGHAAAFSGIGELRENLITMPDDELRSLWTTVKVLDQDLSRKQRAIEMGLACNTVRTRLEESWSMDVEEEIVL